LFGVRKNNTKERGGEKKKKIKRKGKEEEKDELVLSSDKPGIFQSQPLSLLAWRTCEEGGKKRGKKHQAHGWLREPRNLREKP